MFKVSLDDDGVVFLFIMASVRRCFVLAVSYVTPRPNTEIIKEWQERNKNTQRV